MTSRLVVIVRIYCCHLKRSNVFLFVYSKGNVRRGIFHFLKNTLKTDRITLFCCMWKLRNDAFAWCCQIISMLLLVLANGAVMDKKGGFSFNRKKANLRKVELQISGSWWFKAVAQSVKYVCMTNSIMVWMGFFCHYFHSYSKFIVGYKECVWCLDFIWTWSISTWNNIYKWVKEEDWLTFWLLIKQLCRLVEDGERDVFLRWFHLHHDRHLKIGVSKKMYLL